MKKSKSLYFFLFCFGSLLSSFSQNTSGKIRIRKDWEKFYFFQTGVTHDTISDGTGDIFFLKVSDTLKRTLIFSLDNAQLMRQFNDTLLKLRHVPGIRYECFFEKNDSLGSGSYTWKNYVNGASTLKKNIVRIQVTEKNKPELLLENIYIYRD